MKKECTSAQVAIALVQQQSMLPIPVLSMVSRVLENTQRVKLTETQTAEMHKTLQQTEISGGRYPEMFHPCLDLQRKSEICDSTGIYQGLYHFLDRICKVKSIDCTYFYCVPSLQRVHVELKQIVLNMGHLRQEVHCSMKAINQY